MKLGPTALAPGKAMLIGEYAVLEGAPCAVAAVNCYARAELRANVKPASTFIDAALEEARLYLGGGLVEGTPVVDTTAFAKDGKKFGVGSSSAATVAALGCLIAASGKDLADPGIQEALHRAARSAHDRAQGVSGSGADILAAVYGGVRVLHQGESSALPPCPVDLCFVATGESSSTAGFVIRLRERRAHAGLALGKLGGAAADFLDAWRDGDQGALFGAVEEAYEGYRLLEVAIDRNLVTAELAHVHDLAASFGGAAKPSGAGGGDLAVAFLPIGQQQAFVRALQAPLRALPLTISAAGVHVAGPCGLE